MSVAEPPDDDGLFAFLEADMDFDEPEIDEHALPTMSTPQLIKLRTQIQSELRTLGEIRFPKTERGHELHSLSFAITYQLQERGEGR